MNNLKELLAKASRKCEMRWKVLVFDPNKDNELIDEFKDFECIDCATAKKRELLEKHPDKTIEIVSESISRKTEAGKELKVGNQRFYTTNDNGIIFVRKIAPYDDADYYYAVYDPQKVRLVFTQSGGKNKQASMVKYNDTAKQIEEIAKKLIELNKHIQPKMVHESSQKNEGKVNMSKLKNEIQAAVNKYFKDDKDLLEYVHIETKKDKFGRDVLEVRAELGYNSMVKLADYLDKIVTKYDKYAYFDQETSGIMTAVFESAQKNEGIEEQQDAIAKKIADALSAKFGWVLSKEGPYEEYYIGKGLNPINVKIKNDKDLQVQLRASAQPKAFKSVKDTIDFIKSNMNAYGFPGASAFYGKLQSKANKNVERQKARDTYLHDISDSAQKNEDFKNPKTHDEIKPGEWYEVEGTLYQIADRQPIDNEIQAFRVLSDYSVGNGVHVLYKSFYKPDKFKFVGKKDKITKMIKEKEARIAKLKQEIDALKRSL